MTLPKHVVKEDHRLEDAANKSQEELAHLRWHWTLDESNPKRVTFYEYASHVGRKQWTISRMSRGYAAFMHSDIRVHSLTDCIELAGISETNQQATIAIADAMGTNPANVRGNYRDRIKETVSAAQEAAERKGTSISEEIPRIAQAHQKNRESLETQRKASRKNKTVLYAKLELKMGTAQRALMEVLADAKGAELDDELTELIRHSIANIRQIVEMVDLMLTGSTNVDWDNEAERMGLK